VCHDVGLCCNELTLLSLYDVCSVDIGCNILVQYNDLSAFSHTVGLECCLVLDVVQSSLAGSMGSSNGRTCCLARGWRTSELVLCLTPVVADFGSWRGQLFVLSVLGLPGAGRLDVARVYVGISGPYQGVAFDSKGTSQLFWNEFRGSDTRSGR
jgi:hypothetical protein